MSQDTNNPYQPPQSLLSVEHGQTTPMPGPQKAGPAFRFFAGVIGIMLVVSGFGTVSNQIMDICFELVMFIAGVQFVVAGVTGYWYSWTGRRQN